MLNFHKTCCYFGQNPKCKGSISNILFTYLCLCVRILRVVAVAKFQITMWVYYFLVWWIPKCYSRRGVFLNIWMERGINSIKECENYDENQLKQLVFRGIWVPVMVLVGYGSNDDRLSIWEKVDCIVCHSESKHLHQRLLTTCNTSIFWAWVIRNQWFWALLSLFIFCGRRERLKQYRSSQESLAPCLLAQHELAKWLR